jgi:hypothetical protein
MRDGVLLCHLLEVLTGDYLPITTTAAGTGNRNAENGFDGGWGIEFELYFPYKGYYKLVTVSTLIIHSKNILANLINWTNSILF